LLYAASLGALAFVFAGLAALLAQVTLHSRGVYTWGLLVLAAGYVLRGVGDVTNTWVTWLSPLGWAEKAAPFGDMRWWTLLIPLAVGGLLAWLAILVAGRRDLGSALVRGGAGPARASTWLRSPLGLATAIHRPAFLGWLAGTVLLAGLMGALAQQFIDAILGNPAMAAALGVSSGQPTDAMVALTQLYIAIIATACVVQAVASLRGEETAGRLEVRLSGTLSRHWWLVAHVLVIVVGLLVIVVVSSVVLAVGTAWSTGTAVDLGRILAAGAAYLPAELLVGGLALALFGLWPTALPASWAVVAIVAFVAFLGPGLRLPTWVLDLSPTTHIGNPPLGTVAWLPLVVLGAIAAVLGGGAAIGFRRRGVPQN
jgi:ABC-2 type transport system permease protein